MIPMVDDPILRIEWRDATSLKANDWNPNVVFTPEMRLLEHSILETGWVQPVLININSIIIDGFHRAQLTASSRALRERYQGKAPCSVLDIEDAAAMCLTVRINRAKGDHVATRMAGIVKALIDDYGYDPQQIAVEIGATLDEVNVLYQNSIFVTRSLKDYQYSNAWEPRESKIHGRQ
jgi:ParB-like chromosome segregation protein Spo0J